jgi:serine/threonine-protein kinase
MPGLVGGPADATPARALVGTPAYMSPEQALGGGAALGPASDIYSLGAILYEVLSGRRAVADESVEKVILRIQRGDIVPPRQLKAAVPRPLEAICGKAMALRPESRYATALELAGDIEHWLADESVTAYSEPLPVRAGRWARRHKPLVTAAVAATVVVVLLGGAGAWWLDRQRTQLRQAVEADLTEVARLQGVARWAEARAALGRADARLGSGGPSDLRGRLEQIERDLNLVARLDGVRLERSIQVGRRFDYESADRSYAGEFAEAGLGTVGDDPQAVADRVRDSAVRCALVAALDDWALCASRQRWRRDWLLEVARRADPDPWRDRARSPAMWEDVAALEHLAAEEPVTEQSPPLIAALARHLKDAGRDATGLLRRALALHGDDFWLNYELGHALAKYDLELGHVLAKNDLPEAVGYFRVALALRPGTSRVHTHLGYALRQQGRLEEAKAELLKAIQFDAKNAPAHHNLGTVLSDQGRLEEAKAEYLKAIALDAKFARAHYNLGIVLLDQGRLEQAEAEFLKAINLDTKFALPHDGLGNALARQGRMKEAQAEYQKAIGLNAKYAGAHYNLGLGLEKQGRLEEAKAEYQKAIELDPKFTRAHHNLGNILSGQGRLEEAKAEYQKAIAFDAKAALPHNGLGRVLTMQGRLEQAEAEFLKAIKLDTQFAQPHMGLGYILQQHGRLEQAEAEFGKAVALGLKDAAAWMRQCGQWLALTRRLPAVLRGDEKLRGTAERLAFAELCQQPFEKRFAAATQFFTEAFAADPKLASDLEAGHRYNAACAAALAAADQGKDAATLDAKERTRLRSQALEWLKGDLALWGKQAESDQPKARATVQQTLRHWQQDTDLASVRNPDAVKKLPPAEREAWQKLWADVAALLAKLTPAQPPPKKP